MSQKLTINTPYEFHKVIKTIATIEDKTIKDVVMTYFIKGAKRKYKDIFESLNVEESIEKSTKRKLKKGDYELTNEEAVKMLSPHLERLASAYKKGEIKLKTLDEAIAEMPDDIIAKN